MGRRERVLSIPVAWARINILGSIKVIPGPSAAVIFFGLRLKRSSTVDQTPNLSLPYILAAQAQKHVTHNEALRMLDAVVQLSVRDRNTSAPPTAPAEGDRYIVAIGATDAWRDQDNKIAAYQDGAWAFFQPVGGWVAWIGGEKILVAWTGTDWVNASGSINPTTMVGVNATADATNRLSVNAAATLLNHEGSSHRLKINKSSPRDTASVLFQTGFSGRAEFGLTGNDDWHVRVSPDGTTWLQAITINRSNGETELRGRLRFTHTGNQRDWNLGNDNAGNFLIGRGAPGSGDAVAIDRTNLNVQFQSPPRLPSYTVATLPSAATFGAGSMIYVSNAAGGPAPAFSDGSNWRHSSDRAIVR